MSLDAYPKPIRKLVFEFVRDGRPHEDFPACYEGTCACEHEERQRVAQFVGQILNACAVNRPEADQRMSEPSWSVEDILRPSPPLEFDACGRCGKDTPLSRNSVIPGTGVRCGSCRRAERTNKVPEQEPVE